MAETRPYRQNYFIHRKRYFFIVSLALIVAAAAGLAAWYSHSRGSSQDAYAGKVVRISGSITATGLVKTFREGKSISYFSAASGFKDLVFHRFVGDYTIKVIAHDAAEYLEKMKRENQAAAAGKAAEPKAEVADALPPPVDIVSGDEVTADGSSARIASTAAAEKPAALPEETTAGDDEGAPGYAGMRAQGMRAYDRDVKELAFKADEIDSLWQKYRDFCQGTIAVTVGSAFGREWFGIYTTINAADTPECKMMIQDMQTLAAAIDTGMEAAWENAHRAGVYPGHIRSIQKKYRMELDRWNK